MAEPRHLDARRARAALSAYWRAANAAVLALACLEALWEWRLAPLRPGGSWLALKALPLLLVLPGLLRGAPRVRFVGALLLLPYFTEGIVRALTEHGRSAAIAGTAAALAATAFVALFLGARASRRAGER